MRSVPTTSSGKPKSKAQVQVLMANLPGDMKIVASAEHNMIVLQEGLPLEEALEELQKVALWLEAQKG